jgi:hypothetical protein
MSDVVGCGRGGVFMGVLMWAVYIGQWFNDCSAACVCMYVCPSQSNDWAQSVMVT